MLQKTIGAVKAILTADQSVDASERKFKDRVISREAIAECCGVTTKIIDNWRDRGYITPVSVHWKYRAVEYRENDIDALIAGRLSNAQTGGDSHEKH